MSKKYKHSNIVFLLKPWWKHGKLLLLCFGISTIILAPISGYFSVTLAQAVIDRIQAGELFKDALLIGILYMSISLFCSLLRAINIDYYFRWKRQEVEGKIEREIYEKAIDVDYKYFDDPVYFDSYKLATEEFVKKSSETMEYIFVFTGEVAKFVVFGSLIAVRGLAIFLVVLACSVFAAIAQIYWSKISAERGNATVNQRRRIDYFRRLFFDHTAVADMRSSNIRVHLFKTFDKSINTSVSIYKKYASKEFAIDVFSSIAQIGTVFAVPIYVAWGIVSGNISGIGVYATLIAASVALKNTLDGLGWWSSQIALGVAYAKNVRKFFDVESSIETKQIGDKPPKIPFSLNINNVSFMYPNSNFGFEISELSVASGEKIAIVGENGAGKTTLTKLILRLYDTDSGEILINNKNICDYDIKCLRKAIGVVFQQSKLYSLSVRENMTTYASADDATLIRSLNDMDLLFDLDASVTKEFDEDGIVLSGGESQKLCLTRLLHGDFGLLILDEPSSSLDPISEYNLAKLIFNNSKTTTIMIAHRLSTIVDADKIYLFSNGKIIESGTHDYLINKRGKYAEMFEKQSEGYTKTSSSDNF
ncbi:MAG: ABC transporter ATP-binding protein/permease [Oscillospiraceae bacterium]|jgi:ATP-binding cassette subfamily B protein|nr:ABC transporter ATP-binding protein/permease [Oscillospiraceae bacterium]